MDRWLVREQCRLSKRIRVSSLRPRAFLKKLSRGKLDRESDDKKEARREEAGGKSGISRAKRASRGSGVEESGYIYKALDLKPITTWKTGVSFDRCQQVSRISKFTASKIEFWWTMKSRFSIHPVSIRIRFVAREEARDILVSRDSPRFEKRTEVVNPSRGIVQVSGITKVSCFNLRRRNTMKVKTRGGVMKDKDESLMQRCIIRMLWCNVTTGAKYSCYFVECRWQIVSPGN